MMIFLQPQESSKEVIFEFNGEIITATRGGITDTFDLSVLGEGDLIEDINTTLEFNPILSAKRVNGELWVKLLNNYNGENETDEILYPDWKVA